MHLEADISELQKDTGFCPKVRFEDAAKIVAEEYLKRAVGTNCV